MEKKRKFRKFTEEQVEWLIENQDKMTRSKLSDTFNEKFGTNTTRNQIKHLICDRLGYKRTVNEGQYGRCSKRRRKGKPIGAEHEYNGYIWVKYNDLKFDGNYTDEEFNKNWMPKQRYIYEQVHGTIPDGHRVIFLDGNKRNFDIENLYCIDLRINAIMAKNNWFTNDRDHTLTAIKWCELHFVLK